jgi:tetratricopeptide (TPR) repeat protein
MKRFIIVILLYLATLPVISFGEDLHETRLNSGLRSTEAYSYLLIEKAHENSAKSAQLLNEAAKNSPDLPAVYFELAKARFSPSSSGVFESVQYIIEGIAAYSRNFWSAFTLTGSILFSVMVSFVILAAIIVTIRFPDDIQLFAHDVSEAKYLLLILVLLIVISSISPFLFLAGLLVLFGMYMRKIDRIVVYIFLVFLVFSPLLFKAASLFVHALTSSELKAIVEVNESKNSKYALTVLKNGDDYASLFSYGLALKREGRYDEAVSVYQRLIERRPDPRVYVNLGNCYAGLKDTEQAITYYLKALEIKPLASAYYNLSQLSREILDFTKGNEYFKLALETNRDAVSDYRTIYSRNPNRLVVDETLSSAELWGLAMGNKGKTSVFGTAVLHPSFISGTAIILIFLYFLLNNGIRSKAYRCKRCSAILCPRCEKHLTWGRMCQTCYASIVKLDELEAKERVAKLLSIYEHQRKRRNIMKIFSFLMPGVSQIYAGKILVGVLFLWPFLFFLFIPVTNTILAGAGLLFAHSFFTWAAIFFAALIYIISNIITIQRIKKGWL